MILSTETDIKRVNLPGGEFCRYQTLNFDSSRFKPVWGKLDRRSLAAMTDLFRKRLMKRKKELKTLVLFSIPEDIELPFGNEIDGVTIYEKGALAKNWLNKLTAEAKIRFITDDKGNEKPVSSISSVEKLLRILEKRGLYSVSCQKGGEEILFLPLSQDLGYLSDRRNDGQAVCNAHFFLLEFSDAPGPYDKVGDAYGLLITDGEIISPPLYGREALTIDSKGHPSIRCLDPSNLKIEIGGINYKIGSDCSLFERPVHEASLREEGLSLAIVGRNIIASKIGGELEVPHGGFVLHFDRIINTGMVKYSLDEDISFAVQCGPALMIRGEKSTSFQTPYFNGTGATYPPTVFPTDWKSGRAARMGLGFRGNEMVLIWVEGCKVEFYRPGLDSSGLSLEEFTSLVEEEQIENMINLDGGGSAQLFYNGNRELRISDRDENNDDYERPVPLGIVLGDCLE